MFLIGDLRERPGAYSGALTGEKRDEVPRKDRFGTDKSKCRYYARKYCFLRGCWEQTLTLHESSLSPLAS